MGPLPQSLLPVLKRREHKARLALAHITRAIALTGAEIRAMEAVISAVEARIRANLAARLAEAPRTISALLEQEHQTQSLQSGCERVAGLKSQAERRLMDLRVKQRAAAREWRREEVKLMHVKAMARREIVARTNREAEAAEQEFCFESHRPNLH